MEMLHRYQHFFWLIVLLLFCVCVALKLNGSSVGIWEQELSGREASKGLLLFEPQPIRMDEWLVWTPAALSQARQMPRFPVENPNLGPGRAPLLLNLPVAYYTTWFRPQLWGFFVFDFERGFSFCWMTKIFGLVLATAWFLRQLGLRSLGLALFGGTWSFLAMQWWLSSPTMLPEMFAAWAICTGCTIQFFTQKSGWRLAIAFTAFVYCGVNFVLCFYPPAQIPLLYLMGARTPTVWRILQRESRNSSGRLGCSRRRHRARALFDRHSTNPRPCLPHRLSRRAARYRWRVLNL